MRVSSTFQLKGNIIREEREREKQQEKRKKKTGQRLVCLMKDKNEPNGPQIRIYGQ